MSLSKRNKAAAATEYGLLVGLIGVLSIGAVFEYGTTAKDTFDGLANQVANKETGGGAGTGDESAGGSEEVAAIDCYEKSSVGQVGNAGVCDGMLIVDTGLLRQAASTHPQVSGDGSYDFKPVDSYTTHTDGVTYTFADGGDGNIFTGQVDDMSHLFRAEGTFNDDIGYWDTSSVANMSYMFTGATSFNQDITAWDTSNVADMSIMFSGTDAFNQDISGWDTSGVTNMSHMFAGTEAFSQDLSGWAVNPNVVSCLNFNFFKGNLTPPSFSNCTP